MADIDQDTRLRVIASELRERADQLDLMASGTKGPVDSEPAPIEGAGFPESNFEDYGAFYDFLRGNKMLGPKITPEEFAGCDTIIRACAAEKWGVAWVAYALATAYHETAHTMQPVKELGGDAYLTRMYDITGARPKKAKELGNLTPGDGVRFAGRGYPQLTGRRNYAVATAQLKARGWDVDLVTDPDKLLQPDIAAAVMVYGMREGWFTGRDIDDDLPDTGPAQASQFALSRDIINGRDKQELIAGYAMDFQQGLIAGGYHV